VSSSLITCSENSLLEQVLVDTERLRWWGGGASLEDTEVEVPGSDLSVRNIEFAGSKPLLNLAVHVISPRVTSFRFP
jgi:hypothetical protein